MNEWMNEWVNEIINPYALIPVSPAASTSIQGYDNLCVTSQGGSPCSTTNGAHLVYSMQTSCRNTSAKFTFLNGVLKQHCSGKKICPKGVYYGAPLVISDSCEESQAKFEERKVHLHTVHIHRVHNIHVYTILSQFPFVSMDWTVLIWCRMSSFQQDKLENWMPFVVAA